MSCPDNDGTESDDAIERQLSWRMDPEESLSDWTLIVRTEDTTVSKEYHVHRPILAVGPCKSDYFASLFRLPMRETTTKTSDIEMEKDAADAVPLMLDFMYSDELGIVTSEQAVSLRYLSEYFAIKMLHRKVMSFVNEDMNVTNVHRYLQSAKMFHDEMILSMAQRQCIVNIKQMDTTSVLLPSLDPQFFYEVISSPDLETISVSCHISTLVAAYGRLHQGDLCREMFDQLTDIRHMPVIDKKCAIRLLQLSVAAHPTTTSPGTDDMKTIKSTTCLQKRCIQVISEHWREFDGTRTIFILSTLPPIVIAELYGRTIENAKNEMAVVEFELQERRRGFRSRP